MMAMETKEAEKQVESFQERIQQFSFWLQVYFGCFSFTGVNNFLSTITVSFLLWVSTTYLLFTGILIFKTL